MNPTEFLHSNHLKYVEYGTGNFPVSPGFHDVGGVYTSISVTNRGIMDLPFHMNRLFQSCVYLDYFSATESSKIQFIQHVLQSIDQAIFGKPVSNGLLIICCGKTLESSIDVSVLFHPTHSFSSHIMDANYTVNFFPIQRAPAQIKYTKWVLERQPLIDQRDSDVQETLIYYRGEDNVEYLTEGLTTTFYILMEDNTIVMPPTEKILYGSVQRWAQIIAPSLSVNLLIKPIPISSFSEWKGAFVTSSGRIMQPIHKVKFSNEQLLERFPREIVFEYPENHSITKLKDVLFHLIHSPSSKDSDMEKYEQEFLAKIQYNPWIFPGNEHTWGHELLEEGLPSKIIEALTIIQSQQS